MYNGIVQAIRLLLTKKNQVQSQVKIRFVGDEVSLKQIKNCNRKTWRKISA
jgi:hypothetical protein